MNLDELFDDVERQASELQAQHSEQAQNFGYLLDVMRVARPISHALASGEIVDASTVAASGYAVVEDMHEALKDISNATVIPLRKTKMLTLQASTYVTNTTTNSFMVVNCDYAPPALPVCPHKPRQDLAERFKPFDAELAKTCAQITESLYATKSDPERSALWMCRQAWDHLINKLVGSDDDVRKSPFWVKKDGEKPDQVTRRERINFAINKHVADPESRRALEASTQHTLDTYDATNKAHKRGALDPNRERQTVLSMHALLVQWAEALSL